MRQVWAERAHGLLTLTLTTVAAATLSLFIAVLPNEPMEEWIVKRVPENWRVKPENRGGSEYFRLTYLLFDAPGAPFHRNLRLAGKVLVAGEPSVEVLAALQSDDDAERAAALKQVAGLQLMNRDLRFADLRLAILPKVDLRGASLDGADLKDADLSLSDLRRISRKPLRQEEYKRLQEKVNLQINILERLMKIIDKPDNLQRVRSAENAICDDPPLFESCLSNTDDYYAKLIPWLVALGCGDPDVAYGIAKRALIEYTSAGSDDRAGRRAIEFDPLGRLLAAALLASDCEAVAALPENIKGELAEAASWKAPE